MGEPRGRHRAKRTPKVAPVAGAAGVAAAAGAAALGLTPSLSASPELVAEAVDTTGTVWYLRGTEIGDNPSDDEYEDFIGRMTTGTLDRDPSTKTKVDYPASFFPVTDGYLDAPTFDASVGEGLDHLEDSDVKDGDVIFGFSQGAVVASEYKGRNPDKKVTYVLVENPDRPNGGILERFDGLSIPILGVTANGATPNTGPTSAKTIDVSRQYDGWSDFPVYPLNVLADANAIAGIYYLHGKTQSEVSDEDLEAAKAKGGIYYQNDTATNTEYYLIPTERLPLLMPFDGIVPDPILDAADPPLRVLVELGYKRTDQNGDTDYGTPTTVGIAPAVNPVTVASDLANATTEGVDKGLDGSGVSTPNVLSANSAAPKSANKPLAASLTNVSARAPSTAGSTAGTPVTKIPSLVSQEQKPSATPKLPASITKPFSPKDIADNLRNAMGVAKDKPADTPKGEDQG